jgi:hypothetical protein
MEDGDEDTEEAELGRAMRRQMMQVGNEGSGFDGPDGNGMGAYADANDYSDPKGPIS